MYLFIYCIHLIHGKCLKMELKNKAYRNSKFEKIL